MDENNIIFIIITRVKLSKITYKKFQIKKSLHIGEARIKVN